MVKFLLKHTWYLVFILLLIVVSPMLTSWMNFYLKDIFSAAEDGMEKIALLRMLTIGFLVWMSKRFVEFSSGMLKSKFMCAVKKDVKHGMFDSLLGISTADFEARANDGDYISGFTNDITILEQSYFGNIISVLSNVVSIVILGGSFLTLNATMALCIFLFALVTICVPVFFARFLSNKNLEYSRRISLFTQKLKEYFAAYPMIKNYSVEPQIEELFQKYNVYTEDAKFDVGYASALANNVSSLLSWFMQFIAVGVGIAMMSQGEITVPTIIAGQLFASSLASPLQDVLINLNSIRSVKGIVNKIKGYIDAPKQIAAEAQNYNDHLDTLVAATVAQYGIDNQPMADSQLLTDSCAATNEQYGDVLTSCSGGAELAFRNINLQIGDKKIIDNFDFTFKAGKKYLIVGKNGSGKSSVFRILKRYVAGATGQITVNGVPISEMDNETLSRYVSYINENVNLLSGAVKDNIVLYRNCDDQAFDNAYNAAHINIDSDRMVADGGTNISSGERRRIEIARSLLAATPVIVFDEVVSTLDVETAFEIEQMVLQYSNTIVFISHNFSGKLIHEYDEILVMDGGKLISHGTYSELLAKCEYFRKICKIKFGNAFDEV